MFEAWWERLHFLRGVCGTRRRPASKWPVRRPQLQLQPLERRDLLSSSPSLQQAPFLTAGPPSFNLPFLAPIGPGINPLSIDGKQVGENFGQITLTLTGSLEFEIDIEGYIPPEDFRYGGGDLGGGGTGGGISYPAIYTTFEETGSATFVFQTVGAGNSHGAIGMAGWQGEFTVEANWTYTANGYTSSGSFDATVDYPNDFVHGDPYHWYEWSWNCLVPQYILLDCPLGEFGAWSGDSLSFTVSDSGHFESSLVETGFASVSMGTSQLDPGAIYGPPGQFPIDLAALLPSYNTSESGVVGFGYSQLGDYVYTATDEDEFSLYEEGESNLTYAEFAPLALTCINYQENGAGNYGLHESGTGTAAGGGTITIAGDENAGSTTGSITQVETFSFQDVGSYSYDEGGEYAYELQDLGTDTYPGLNLSVSFDETGDSSAMYTATGGSSLNGEMTRLDESGTNQINADDPGGYDLFSSSTEQATSRSEANAISGGGNYQFTGQVSDAFTYNLAGSYADWLLRAGDTITGGGNGTFGVGAVYTADGESATTFVQHTSSSYSGSGTTTKSSSNSSSGSSSDQGTESGSESRSR